MMDVYTAQWFWCAARDAKATCAVCGEKAQYVLRTTASRLAIRETSYTQKEWDLHSEDWIDHHDHREYRCTAHAPKIKKRVDDQG